MCLVHIKFRFCIFSIVEIANINNYEVLWKIRTNITKFKIIPIGRNKTSNIKVDNKIYEYTRKGKVLGLTITSDGYSEHIHSRINMASANMKALFMLRNLSTTNKKKIYEAVIKSTLTYPAIPSHLASNALMLKMQRVQNKAVYVITNTRRAEGRRLVDLHLELGLVPINKVLNNRASDIWLKVIDMTPLPELETMMPERNLAYKKNFGSSLLKAMEEVYPIVT